MSDEEARERGDDLYQRLVAALIEWGATLGDSSLDIRSVRYGVGLFDRHVEQTIEILTGVRQEDKE